MIRLTLAARLAAPALLALALGLAPQLGIAGPTLQLDHPVAAQTLPDSKHTIPGLYITASEAGRVLANHPNLALIDVRTPAETMLIGYPTAAAANIPSKFIDPAHPYAPAHHAYGMIDNPGFIAEVKAWLTSDAGRGVDTLLIMCRSGSRSAAAINQLARAGVRVTLYNVVDGFEGDKTSDGVRAVNGWRNAGLPWTYKVRPGLWPGH